MAGRIRMRSALSVSVVVCLAVVVTASGAQAQSRHALSSGGWDLHLYRPAVDSKGLLSVNGTDILGANAFSFGLIMDAGFGLLPYDGFRNDASVHAADRERVGRLVDYSFTGTLH